MLTRAQKEQRVEELRAALAEVSTFFILENEGVTVNRVTELRRKIRDLEAAYKVHKNSIVRRACEGTPLEPLTEGLVGPNVFAYTSGDPVELAKTLKEYTDEHDGLSFKEGFVDGSRISAAEVEQLAKLPSREQQLTQLASLLQSPMRRLVVALNAPLQQFASVAKQVAEKKDNE